jgi:beta-lactamase superfamily II metal-dependent hydrolase
VGLPSAAELEAAPLSIVVFGPGFGESLVVRAAGEAGPRWAVVDSARRERAGSSVNPAGALLAEQTASPTLVVLTHSHLDHTSGLAEIVDGLRPGATIGCVEPLLTAPSPHAPAEDPDDRAAVQRSQTDLAHTAITRAWSAGAGKWSTIEPMSFTLNGWTLTVLHPDSNAVAETVERFRDGRRVNLNNLSALLLVERGDIAVVLGADSEQEAWAAVEERLRPADLVQVRPVKSSHHGSTTGIHQVLVNENAIDPHRRHVVTPFPRSGTLPRFDPDEGAERLLRAADQLHLTAMPVDLIPTGGSVGLSDVRAALTREDFEGDAAFDIRDEQPEGAGGLIAGTRDPLETWVLLGVHVDGRVEVSHGGHAVVVTP